MMNTNRHMSDAVANQLTWVAVQTDKMAKACKDIAKMRDGLDEQEIDLAALDVLDEAIAAASQACSKLRQVEALLQAGC